eukprot:4134730-Prymnesium_polylepis.1
MAQAMRHAPPAWPGALSWPPFERGQALGVRLLAHRRPAALARQRLPAFAQTDDARSDHSACAASSDNAAC